MLHLLARHIPDVFTALQILNANIILQQQPSEGSVAEAQLMLFSEHFVHSLNITFTSGMFGSQNLFGHVNFIFTHLALLFPSDSYYFFDTFYINADQTGNLLAADTLFMQGDNCFSVVNWYHRCHP